jgi:hypothetical protein
VDSIFPFCVNKLLKKNVDLVLQKIGFSDKDLDIGGWAIYRILAGLNWRVTLPNFSPMMLMKGERGHEPVFKALDLIDDRYL